MVRIEWWWVGLRKRKRSEDERVLSGLGVLIKKRRNWGEDGDRFIAFGSEIVVNRGMSNLKQSTAFPYIPISLVGYCKLNKWAVVYYPRGLASVC